MHTPKSIPSYKVLIQDVAYRTVGNRVLRALIYQPIADGVFPACVCVHGGAWVSGDRTATERWATQLAACGLVVMAIDFRMGPPDPYPSSLQDINFAVRWLKQSAQTFSIDSRAVGGFGVSSGGHLILLSGMRPNDPRYTWLQPGEAVDTDASLAFVVSCSGVLDPLARYEMAKSAGYADILACHHAYFGNEVTMDEASPPRILARGEPVALPPALFFQGTADQRLPADTAGITSRRYQEAGGQAEAVIYPAMGHVSSEWGTTEIADVLVRVANLVTQVLSNKGLA